MLKLLKITGATKKKKKKVKKKLLHKGPGFQGSTGAAEEAEKPTEGVINLITSY